MMSLTNVLVCQSLATLLISLFIYSKNEIKEKNEIKDKIFILKGSFVIGEFILYRFKNSFLIKSLIKINLKCISDVLNINEKLKKAKEITAAQISYFLMFLFISLITAAVSENYKTIIYINLLSLVLCLYIFLSFYNSKKQISDEIDSALPNVYLKLTLLLSSGIILKNAWKEVAYSSDEKFYKLMQKADKEVENGESFSKALEELSKSTDNHEVRKFVLLILENIRKGGDNLRETFLLASGENFEMKKQKVKKKAIIADQRLLFPIILMFIGIVFMIIVPLFSDIMK